MLGGHIDVYVASPRSMVPLQNEGRVRILAISAPQRQAGPKANLPTFRELGHDAVFFTWRGFMGPKGLKASEIAYWDQVFAKLAQSEEWRKEADQQMWVADYTLSAETKKHLDRESEILKSILADLGLTKS
jgi:putative tricarboxylic transport membrane protein